MTTNNQVLEAYSKYLRLCKLDGVSDAERFIRFERLKPRHKEVCILYFLKGLNLTEVGESLGLTGRRIQQLMQEVVKELGS